MAAMALTVLPQLPPLHHGPYDWSGAGVGEERRAAGAAASVQETTPLTTRLAETVREAASVPTVSWHSVLVA